MLASSATRFQVEAAARTLGIDHVLSTALEAGEDGILTGRADGPTLWRAGKARAVREFAAEHDIDLAASYAYSNGNEDIAFLSQVGHPAATTPEEGLREHATQNGWPVLRLPRPRDARPARRSLRVGRGRGRHPERLRHGRGVGGPQQQPAAGDRLDDGAVGGVLPRPRRCAASTSVGEEHVWEQRPAVFVFNHQSQLDVFVICYLLRRDFTGVAKKELTKDPIFGPVFRLAEVAFVDRKGSGNPREALQPAVDKLR